MKNEYNFTITFKAHANALKDFLEKYGETDFFCNPGLFLSHMDKHNKNKYVQKYISQSLDVVDTIQDLSKQYEIEIEIVIDNITEDFYEKIIIENGEKTIVLKETDILSFSYLSQRNYYVFLNAALFDLTYNPSFDYNNKMYNFNRLFEVMKEEDLVNTFDFLTREFNDPVRNFLVLQNLIGIFYSANRY